MEALNEAKIIMALNEAKKKKIVKESDDGDYTYKCPECGYVFSTDEEITKDTECKCPECGSVITPECKESDEDPSKDDNKTETKKIKPKSKVNKKNEGEDNSCKKTTDTSEDDPDDNDTNDTNTNKDDESKKVVRHKKITKKNEGATPAGPSQGDVTSGGMNVLYRCPDCGGVFTIDLADFDHSADDQVECPNCGAVVSPEELGSLYTDEASEAFVPKAIKVIHGKVTKIKAHKKQKITGSRLAKLLKNLKKARMKAHSGRANASRRKSMKKARKLNSSFNIDENILMEMLNNVIDDVMEEYSDTYENFKITKVNEAIYDEDDDTLGIDADIKYDDGEESYALFTVEGLDTEDKFTVTEHTGILDLNSLEIYGEGEILDNGNIDITEMSYLFCHNGRSFEESFEVE